MRSICARTTSCGVALPGTCRSGLPPGTLPRCAAPLSVASTPIPGASTPSSNRNSAGGAAVRGWTGTAPCSPAAHGETFNCPAEVNEARNGLYVDQMALNLEPGGEGRFTGGRGIVMDYRVRADDGFLTVGYTRSRHPSLGARRRQRGLAQLRRVHPARGRAAALRLRLGPEDAAGRRDPRRHRQRRRLR